MAPFICKSSDEENNARERLVVSTDILPLHRTDLRVFLELVDKYKYDFSKLAYIIFPFGEEGSGIESPYDWHFEEWDLLSAHLANPATRFIPYKLAVSSGNGAAKTAFGAMTFIMLMYTQQLRARITANTDPQMKSIVWPEYDIWCQRARHFDEFFEKFGTSIKALDEKLGETWRLDAVNWSLNNPVAMSGLHNAKKAVALFFEEAPGIPATIFKYAHGCFSDEDTIRIWLCFGNSDDPNSYFEQLSKNKGWRFRRIDTRTQKHVSREFIQAILDDCNGDTDHDDFRVRVLGLPRKAAKDSIISAVRTQEAIARGVDFDIEQVKALPCVLTCDPAWTGGDECTIWVHQGHWSKLLDKYKLDKEAGETHQLTYAKLCVFEKQFSADMVLIDQGEGTAIYTLAVNDQKTSWQLVSFSESANDEPTFALSQYQNIRAQMYFEANTGMKMAVIQAEKPEWLPTIQEQMGLTKGTRNTKSLKKQAVSKDEIKEEYGYSPDVSDGYVLRYARKIYSRLPENEVLMPGEMSHHHQEHKPYNPYEVMDVDYREI